MSFKWYKPLSIFSATYGAHMRARRFFKPSFALPPSGPAALFTLQDLENAYGWIFKLRKKYSHNSDIWELCRTWNQIKHFLFESLNDGSYQFSSLERLEFKDGTLSLWTSQDMIALKLITQALERRIGFAIPKSCYHVKDHGGLKHAVRETQGALPHHHFVMRSCWSYSHYTSTSFWKNFKYVNAPPLFCIRGAWATHKRLI